MAIAVKCKVLTLPDRPRFRLLSMGVIEKAWTSIDKAPSAFDLLLQFQDNMNLALAPIRQYMELVEAMALFYKCIGTIPDCITSLSPDPLLDCLKNLAKAIARVVAWIPPINYIAMAVDIGEYCINMIDAMFTFFARLDTKIDQLVTSYNMATSLNDSALLAFSVCGIESMLPKMVQMIEMALGIKPLCNTVMDPFIRLLGMENLKKIKEMYEDANKSLNTAKADISAGAASLVCVPGHNHAPPSNPQGFIPIPPMAPVLCLMNQSRNAMVLMYNTMAQFVGDDPNKTMRQNIPEFVYF